MRITKVWSLLLAVLLVTFMFSSCDIIQNPAKEQKDSVVLQNDSTTLNVAVYPSECCLPIYFAKASGIYDSLGLDVELLRLNAMEDCDTALVCHRAEVVVSDMARVLVMKKDGYNAAILTELPNHMRLLTARGKRLRDFKQLKERLIALERHSETDYWSDRLVESNGMESLDIFRTQFNRHKLREEMLSNTLLEAAFLDEPFASFAQVQGAQTIWTRDEANDSWNVLACPKELLKVALRTEQISKLMNGYDIAVRRLNAGERRTTSDSILVNVFGFTKEAVDTLDVLQPSKYGHSTTKPASSAALESAKEWLLKRNWISKSINTEGIIWKRN